MNEEDIKLLEDNDWIIVCESPFEIEDPNNPENAAQGYAAQFILETLKKKL